MKKNLLIIVLTIALLAFAGYTVFSLSAVPALASTQPASPALPATFSAAPKFSAVTDWESELESIYSNVNPSVVLINVSATSTRGGSRSPFSQGPQQAPAQQALGSGFVWDTNGYIVTNNHVIDGATRITVTFADGTTMPAKLVGADPNSDLAVIQVQAPANSLHPVQVADSNQVKVGQFAIAIGNPFGEQNTMTTGIISAIGRSLPVDNGQALQGPTYTIPDVIQTDAPINPGNSGGVLLNAQGQLIGVTQSIESNSGSSSGIGFAIPSAIVQKVVPSLIKSGHYDHPYLGISGTTVTPDLAQAMGLNANQRGALVAQVTPGGPAEKAGLQGSTKQTTVNGVPVEVGGDVITAINGQPIKSFDDLVAYLASSTTVNQTVNLTVLRDGKEQTVTLTIGARPAASASVTNPFGGN